MWDGMDRECRPRMVALTTIIPKHAQHDLNFLFLFNLDWLPILFKDVVKVTKQKFTSHATSNVFIVF